MSGLCASGYSEHGGAIHGGAEAIHYAVGDGLYDGLENAGSRGVLGSKRQVDGERKLASHNEGRAVRSISHDAAGVVLPLQMLTLHMKRCRRARQTRARNKTGSRQQRVT